MFGATPVGFADGFLHGCGDGVGIHDDQTVEVPGGASCRLGQGPARTQEALFVGIQDGYKGNGRDVQTFAQEVHANEHVKETVLEILDNFHPLGRVHIGVDVAASYARTCHIFVEFLGHAFGKGGDQDAFVNLSAFADLFQQVVHLVFGGTDLYGRIQQAGGPHDLFHHQAARLFQFIVGRGCAHINGLMRQALEFFKGERPVVRCGGQPESIFYEYALAGMVSAVHGPDLGQGHVAFVNEGNEVVWEIIQQAEGPLARLPSVKIPRIVFNSGAVSHFFDHFQIILYTLLQAFGLQRFADFLEPIDLGFQVVLDVADGLDAAFACGDEVAGRVDGDFFDFLDGGPRHRVDDGQPVHLVAEKLDADGVIRSAEEDIDRIPAHAEGSPLEIRFGPRVQSLHQLVQQAGETPGLAFADVDGLGVEIVRIPDAVQAGYAGNDDDVPPARHQGRRRAEPQLVDALVDAEVFFNIGIRRGDVGFGLIVVVIRYEVLDRIGRKKRLEFAIQLGCKRFVVA